MNQDARQGGLAGDGTWPVPRRRDACKSPHESRVGLMGPGSPRTVRSHVRGLLRRVPALPCVLLAALRPHPGPPRQLATLLGWRMGAQPPKHPQPHRLWLMGLLPLPMLA